MASDIKLFMDFKKLNQLLKDFSTSTGFVAAILDLQGNVLSQSGWREICNLFHRKNPETAHKCVFSNPELASKLSDGRKYFVHSCLNGLVDVSTPIEIDGEHLANLFIGQFFFEQPDVQFFKNQAKKYGFNEEKYLKALEEVPVCSEEKALANLNFLSNMVQIIGELGSQKNKFLELNNKLNFSEEKFRLAFHSSPDARGITRLKDGVYLDINPAFTKIMGHTRDDVIGKPASVLKQWVDMKDRERLVNALKEKGQVVDLEARFRTKSGRIITGLMSSAIITIDNEPCTISAMREISGLRENERRLSGAERIGKLGNWSFNVSDASITWSEGLYRIFGRDPVKEKVDYDKLISWIHPDDRDMHNAYLAKMLALKKGEQIDSLEYRFILPNTETRWAEVRYEVDWDEKSKPTRFFGTVQDITGQKQAMDVVKKYESIVAGSHDLMSVLDKNYRYVVVNNSYLKAFNLDLHRTVGCTATDLFGQEFFETKLKPKIDRCLQGEHINFQQWIEFPAYGHKYMDVNYYPYMDENGHIAGVVVNARDNTERKQYEERLKESEANLKSLINNREDYIWSLDKDYRYITFNETYALMFYNHYKRDCEPGLNSLDFLSEDEKKFWVIVCERAFTGEHVKFEYSYDLGKGMQYFQTSINPIYEEKEITGLSLISVEISEQVKIAHRFKALFEHAPVPLWEEDFSAVKKIIDGLKKRGVKNFRKYFDTHPEVLEKCIQAVKILEVNQHVLNLHEAQNKEELFGGLDKIFTSESVIGFKQELIAIAEGNSMAEFDSKVITLKGNERAIHLKWNVVPGYEESLERIYISTEDITNRKKAEEQLQVSRERLIQAQHIAKMGDFTWDVETGEVTWSDGLFDLLKYDKYEVIDYAKVNAEIHHPEDLESVTQWLNEGIQSGKDKLAPKEYRIIRKDGETIYIRTEGVFERTGGKTKLFATLYDITERKKAEEEIKEIGIKLSEAASLTKMGYWELDIPSNNLVWSDEVYRIFGVKPQTFNATYEAFLSYVHPDDRETVNKAYTNSLITRKPYDIVHRVLPASGETKYVREKCHTDFNEKGEPLRSIGAVLDITEQVLAEQEIAAAKAYFQTIYNATTDAIFIHDAETGKIIDVNQTMVKMYGYDSKEEVLSLSFDQLGVGKSPYSEKEAIALMQKAKEEGPQTMEWPVSHKNGTIFWTEVSIRYTQIDNQNRFVVSVRNIEDRKKSEEEIKTINKRLTDILENMSDAFVALDRNWQYTYMNSKAGQIFNREAKKMIGKHIWTEFPEGVNQPFHLNYEKAMNEKTFIKMEEYYPPYDKWFENRINPTNEGIAIFFSDITQRKKQEKELRDSEERFRLLVENIPQVFYLSDPQKSKMDYISPAYENVWGQPREQIYKNPKSFLDSVFPEDRPQVIASFEKQAAGESIVVEYRIKNTQGQIRNLLSRAFPVYDSDEKLSRIAGIVEDITERKEAEEALSASEEYLSSVMRTVADPIFTVKMPERKIEFINEAVSSEFGYSPDEVIGNTTQMFYPTEAAYLAFGKILKNALENNKEKIRVEQQLVTKDGNLIWTEIITTFLFSSGKLDRVLSIVRDITDRKKAENDLRESEQRYREAQNTAHIAHWAFNPITGENWWSDEVYNLYGLNPENGPLAYDEHVKIIHPEDWPNVDAVFRGAIEKRNPFELVFRIIRPDGNERIVNAIGKPVVDENNQVAQIGGTIQDITSLKQAEEEVKKLNKELEQRVKDRTKKLEEINNELKSFTYSVSHDLKAPLRGIDGYSKLLIDLYGGKLEEEPKQFLKNIRQGTAQMNQLINDLLAYSRLERGQLRPQQINIQTLINEIIKSNKTDLQNQNTQFTTNAVNLYVSTDLDSLTIAIRNLIDNAIKFSQKVENPIVEISTKQTENDITIVVKDNGIGFDMRFHNKIFQIFQRLQRSEDYPGTGVGLALVEKSIRRIGGSVWAESNPGKGATFYLKIPIKLKK